ncbi:hypothetical protein [Luteimonas fraxinea]|uniref:Uncharacterized protein n=1 Tax=Luteimonas fraxinea TaxID=2901869 RepID=A0ABS8UBQ7_9GAMM|nr:hypothetical protein [Luteimonas fraxinea]MCD9096154.1 hypothetical protein [Luteimonas fraxinea]
MSSNVIPMHNARAAKAAGVFAQTNIAARRLGYSDHLALRAAQRARDAYKAGGKSAARVISEVRESLRRSADSQLA